MQIHPTRICVLSAVVAAGEMTGCGGVEEQTTRLAEDERVIFFPTCAHYDDDEAVWVVPIRGWVFEPEHDSAKRAAALGLFRKSLDLDEEETEIFQERARPFIVDNERDKILWICLRGEHYEVGPTEPNGQFETELRLSPVAVADENEWLPYQLQLGGHDDRESEGQVQFVGGAGWSVISDIDDTIKVSNVTDRKELLANTFLRQFEPVDGMPGVFRALADRGAVFHYVSSSPWQLYGPLEEMMKSEGFPAGSMHLKTFRWKDSSFFDLFASPEETKPPVLETILRRYPRRKFVLFGDSGERDPEIYGALARRFPEQVVAIAIRAVDEAGDDADRYEEAFRDLPRGLWMVFRDSGHLSDHEALRPALGGISEE